MREDVLENVLPLKPNEGFLHFVTAVPQTRDEMQMRPPLRSE